MVGDPITGQRVVDGNASVATALTLYNAGEAVARVLAANEWLHITHLVIACESGGDVVLTQVGGQVIFDANLVQNAVVDLNFDPPRVCEKGAVPTFAGPITNKTSIYIQGFITEV